MMKLLVKQENAIYYLKDGETEEVIYGGAAGGGKSAIGCLWLIECCQKYPGSRWVMARSKLKNLKETTLKTFFEISSKLGISNQYTFNSQRNVVIWNNGSEILLKDLFMYPKDPEFDSLGSLEITGAFVDECNQIVYKAWQVLKSRIRFKLTEFKLIPKILGTCNPSKNWVYKDFYKLSRDKVLPDYRKFIKALPKDNPHLHESYLQTLLRLDKNSRERLYYGNWEYDDDPSTLIDSDSISDYWNGEHVQPNGEKYMTIDVARLGADTTVFRIWHGWLCIDRVCMKISHVNEVVDKAKDLMKKHGVSRSNVVADEDGIGGGVVDFLRCKGFVNNAKPLNGENYDNLKSQCSMKMAEKICNKEVAERQEDITVIDTTSEEMEQVKQKDVDKDGKKGIVPKDVVKQKLGRSPDDWDSIMMRYYFALTPKSKGLKVID